MHNCVHGALGQTIQLHFCRLYFLVRCKLSCSQAFALYQNIVFLRFDFLGLDDHSKRRLRAFTSSAEALHTSIADGNLSYADFSDDAWMILSMQL